MKDNKKVAIVFGTFAPLHKGHIDLIIRAKRENDRVIVVVSGYNEDRGYKIGLPLEKRFRYIREVYNDDKLVEVVKLDETNIPRYPDGWTQWLKELKHITKLSSISNNGTFETVENNYNMFDVEMPVFYVSEEEYKEELEKRGFLTNCGPRQFNISATKIRQEPRKYWNFIAPSFRRHFTTKVLIIGSASNGKTTLALDLGLFFNCPVVLEYAREYQVVNNVKDDELVPKDFFHLLLGQNKLASETIDGPVNNGLIIADTNSTVTTAYYDLYCRGIDPEEDETFDGLYTSLVKKEKWDAIIFVNPTGNYVDDGFRDMSMADTESRDTFTIHLKELIKKDFPNIEIFNIGGNYLKNYEEAKAHIENLLIKN